MVAMPPKRKAERVKTKKIELKLWFLPIYIICNC